MEEHHRARQRAAAGDVEKLVSQPVPFPAPPDRAASVLPLHGRRVYAPNSVLVRARLGEGVTAQRTRAVIALFAEVCDSARASRGAEARWWTAPVEIGVERVADGALLSLDEAEAALADLEAVGLLAPVERGHRIEADALCECPALLHLDFEAARERLRGQGQVVGPATALLREIVRLADDQGAVSTTVPRLLDAVLYGRTRLTQALSTLERVGLVERRDLPNRMVRLQLLDGAAPMAPPVSRPDSQAASLPSKGGRMRLPVNAPLQIGGEWVHVAPGIVPELELGPDGRYYLWLGPVRIGPYNG